MIGYEEQWAPFEIPSDGTVTRAFGPLSLTIARQHGEWRVRFERAGEYSRISAKPQPPQDLLRFVASATTSAVSVVPALAERPIVARPELPIIVLAGDDVRLYVSIPLSVRMCIGDTNALLAEIETVRLSDTWFGPSTREGDLCYASLTGARSRFEDVPHSRVRATTSVRISNRSGEHFRIERIKIPAPYLSLFVDDDGWLWTEEIRVTRGRDGEATEPAWTAAPQAAGDTKLVLKPRRSSSRSFWSRGIEALLG